MTNSIYSQLTVLAIVLSCLAISYCQTNSFNRKINSNKYKQHQQPSTTNANESDDDVVIHPIRNKNIPTYSCHNKEDDGYYEHEESCHKYWHCLYVDTIFERAFERYILRGDTLYIIWNIIYNLSCKLANCMEHKLK